MMTEPKILDSRDVALASLHVTACAMSAGEPNAVTTARFIESVVDMTQQGLAILEDSYRTELLAYVTAQLKAGLAERTWRGNPGLN